MMTATTLVEVAARGWLVFFLLPFVTQYKLKLAVAQSWLSLKCTPGVFAFFATFVDNHRVLFSCF
jgi:hypothetical protein